jgi:ATP-dependent helicase YprA (DUF1998 family)
MQTVDSIVELLKKEFFKVAHLHGDCTQQQRDQAVQDFKAGKCQILVATDVVARGLHIRNLPYIVNYDFPTNIDTYVHRCGRTGARPRARLLPLDAFPNHFPLPPETIFVISCHNQETSGPFADEFRKYRPWVQAGCKAMGT